MKVVNPNADELRIIDLFKSRGLDSCNISLHLSLERSAQTMETPFRTTDEGFIIRHHHKVEPEADIIYASLRGLYFALITLSKNPEAEGFDYPRFSLRGIIEGFYGPPWGSQARRDMILMLPEMRMNSYFYGPKDDPYHRELWAEPYPAAELKEISELQHLCRTQETDFWYGIGPGLSMHYSSTVDRRALCNKLFQLFDIGIRQFGLYLDDIPEHLQHEDDQTAFADLVEAHISLINEVYHILIEKDPEIRLVVCPTPYWGEPGYYISRLSAGIDYRIMIFHTGPEICSRELSLRDAAQMQQITNRPVLYWDNYPVNDLEMSHSLHVGPYQNRDPHLYRVSSGVIANGMEYPEASKIPFLTIGDYLWNPEAYDPEESFREAVKRIAGENDWEDFFPFADNNRASCLYPNDNTLFKQRIEAFGFTLNSGELTTAISIIQDELNRLDRAAVLFKRGMRNNRLEGEIQPWISQYLRAVDILHEVIDIFNSPKEQWPELIRNLSETGTEYAAARWYVFSDVMTSFIREIIPGLKDVLKEGVENE